MKKKKPAKKGKRLSTKKLEATKPLLVHGNPTHVI
jgi:hypothetical protein